jgi:protein SCO1
MGLIGATEPSRAAEPYPRTPLASLLWPKAENQNPDQAAHLTDRVVVVSFLTTTCEITCVIRTRDLAATARSLPGALRERVAFLAISLDSVRDDASALRAFADSLGLEPAQISVLGSDPATAEHLKAALRWPADRSEPPDAVLVFDRTGQLAMRYGANPLDRPRLARDLAELDRFAHGVGHPPTTGVAPAL